MSEGGCIFRLLLPVVRNIGKRAQDSGSPTILPSDRIGAVRVTRPPFGKGPGRCHSCNPADTDLFLPLSGLRDIIGSLHPQGRIHLHSKGFFDAERHIPGKLGLAVDQAGERGPGNPKCRYRRRH